MKGKSFLVTLLLCVTMGLAMQACAMNPSSSSNASSGSSSTSSSGTFEGESSTTNNGFGNAGVLDPDEDYGGGNDHK